MIYLGIDVASKKHDCFMVSADGVIYGDVFTIPNNRKGFESLVDSISCFIEICKDENIRIGLESTGVYSNNILNFLSKQGYQVSLINPLLTNMDRKATSVRKTKTDKVDAKAICRFLSRNQDLESYTPPSYHSQQLKTLSRCCKKVTKQLTREKVALYTLIVKVFPEYLNVFASLYSKGSLALLHKYGTPSIIVSTRVDAVGNLLNKASKGHHGLTEAKKIKGLAQSTIGEQNDIYAFEIRLLIERIRMLTNHKSEYEKQITKLLKENYAIILSIPGVGPITGGFIIGEIGNINRFDSPDKLLAFAGLDPSVYQSGEYDANKTSISKRGSSYLRWAIHIAATGIVRNDVTFSKYHQKKLKEGKHYYVAIGHVTKKLTRVIYSLLKYNKAFIPQA